MCVLVQAFENYAKETAVKMGRKFKDLEDNTVTSQSITVNLYYKRWAAASHQH